jgi:anti-sigma factor RsiW
MICRELVELVTHYLEGALSADDTARFEGHIADCVWCTRYVEQMRVTIVTVARLEGESISPATREAVLAAFSEWRQ